MFNFHNKKNRRKISVAVIILIILAMVISTLAYFMS
jgi:hypothetical protein